MKKRDREIIKEKEKKREREGGGEGEGRDERFVQERKEKVGR